MKFVAPVGGLWPVDLDAVEDLEGPAGAEGGSAGGAPARTPLGSVDPKTRQREQWAQPFYS